MVMERRRGIGRMNEENIYSVDERGEITNISGIKLGLNLIN